jgi:hypothetical protein
MYTNARFEPGRRDLADADPFGSVRGGGGRAGAEERTGDRQAEREPPHARV